MNATNSPGGLIFSRILFIKDRELCLKFMIDTGADVSAIPPSSDERRHINPNFSLHAVNRSSIPTFGNKSIRLDLGLRRQFQFIFVIADVPCPILGADFLSAFNLYPDIRGCRLVDSETKLWAACISSASSLSSTSALLNLSCLQHSQSTASYEQILAKFPELTRPLAPDIPIKHDVQHHIKTQGPPKSCRFRRLAPQKLKQAQSVFQHMLDLGIIRVSESSWSSALHMVPESTPDDWRPVGDYRALNSVTEPDSYPLPLLQECFAMLHGKQVFSKIDLVRAYHQIPVAPEDISKTAIKTPFGLFEYVKMPFGLKNAAQTFQRFIDTVLRGLDFVFVYIDDILIASNSESEHQQQIETVFKRLVDFGLIINQDKCVFGQKEVNYLGHRINANGCAPLAEKVAAVKEFPSPNSRRQIRRFLGMINFYRRFIPNCAALAAPLNNLTGSEGNEVNLTAKKLEAFESLKTALSNATVLAHPDPSAPLSIMVDASNDAAGAVLHQGEDSQQQPLAFFSRAFSKTEKRYSTFGRELLAAYLAIKHFRHLSGFDNIVADTLSRAQINGVKLPDAVDYKQLALDRQEAGYQLSSLPPTFASVRVNDSTALICDTKNGMTRPLLPVSWRRKMFDLVHSLSHPGLKATKRLMCARYTWSGMSKDVREWTRACIKCQKTKVQFHNKSVVGTFPLANARFSHVHVDLVGPLPSSKGQRYLLTCVDRYTR